MNPFIKYIILSLLMSITPVVYADPFRDGVVAYQQQNYQQALDAWLPLAESGHVLAQTLIGSMYAYGEGVERNDNEAFKWLSRAANTGSAQAQYNLAILYEKGFGTSKNKEQAQKWFKAAADQGRKDAALRYNNLVSSNTDETPPKQRIHVTLNNDDDIKLLGPPDTPKSGLAWFNQQPLDNYTIQLAASIEPRLIEAFKNQIKLESNYANTTSSRNGRQWYAVIFGSYSTVNEARQKISELPDEWKTWQPWIKTFSSVKHINN